MKATAYDRMAGKSIEVITPPPDETEDLNREQRIAWLNHPYSKKLLEFLYTKESEYKDAAVTQAASGGKKHQVTKPLIKAAAIREIVEHINEN